MEGDQNGIAPEKLPGMGARAVQRSAPLSPDGEYGSRPRSTHDESPASVCKRFGPIYSRSTMKQAEFNGHFPSARNACKKEASRAAHRELSGTPSRNSVKRGV